LVKEQNSDEDIFELPDYLMPDPEKEKREEISKECLILIDTVSLDLECAICSEVT
jgi:hypothetical protein